MICISINQESRRFALADMLNASRQCDLLEIRLDRFSKAPDIKELLDAKPCPVIMSCRRASEGGSWTGSEEDRLALLRQCIVSKADYVEIELDVADQIRRFPPSQRVISYTSNQETPADLSDIYEQMQSKNPDVIKLVTLARTPEEAWPLVQILAKQRVPTVAVGLGKPGIMLSILGRKIGAPWIYAALERGMEAYPGQTTVHDLQDVYHYESITRSTRLIGVTGFSDGEVLKVAALNAALAFADLPARCLPLAVGDVRLFRKIIDAVKLAAVVLDPENQAAGLEIANELHSLAKSSKRVDLLLNKEDSWHGFDTLNAALLARIEGLLKSSATAEPLHGKIVLIAGLNETALALAREFVQRGAGVVLASYQRKAGGQAAGEIGCRFVQFEAIATTSHHALIVCDHEQEHGREGVHPGYLKPGMIVADLTAQFLNTPLLDKAAAKGCSVIRPQDLFFDQMQTQSRYLTGKRIDRTVFEKAVPDRLRDNG